MHILKATILQHLCPDTDDRFVAREKSQRCLQVGESIDELAYEIEKLLKNYVSESCGSI